MFKEEKSIFSGGKSLAWRLNARSGMLFLQNFRLTSILVQGE